MQTADVAIIGAGAAGSLAAIMLARAGHSVVLIDPTHPYRPEFRCEKIDYRHAEVLSAAGVLKRLRAELAHLATIDPEAAGRMRIAGDE